MFNSRILRVFAICNFLLLTVGLNISTANGQHPCDNYPVTICNVPTSFSAWTLQDDNTTATQQVGEPFVVFPNPMKSLWYAWIAPTNGTVVANTRGTNANSTFVLDTELAVYRATGSGTISTLQQIVANDDWSNASVCSENLDAPRPPDELQNSSCVLFAATAGEKYFFQVDGYANTAGPFFLNAYYLSPTAANLSVSGQIKDNLGRGVARASIVLTAMDGSSRTISTNPFGYYRFEELEAGQTYTIEVRHKSMSFINNPRILSVDADLQDVDFIGF